ncbi:hypothetical protein B0F90DRAFT_244094 [Multifurca ochricompacta]|uniref:BZIP domain-containing protein n=1 Tax=Multifurca ochricompacta TaxID=376703 RepID=A0AAD4QP30_9AGAM|nr:hypothetical protein B0F90DRAFT_244094 [Multifurca ochricompacta]
MTDSNLHTRERSLSGDFESDPESPQELFHDDAPAGKPGRKKNPNSQAARRDQNRIAQREFRLRKQQRIRDLEARVEILSGGKDEALSEMRNILKDLMAENHVLRGFLRSLSEFIGDGAGGLLSKLGWSMQDFDKFVNKSETDTAYESYQRRKREGQLTSTTSGLNSQSAPRKRPSEDDVTSGAKRARGPSERDEADRSTDAFPVLIPMNQVPSGSNLYTGRSPQEASLFSDLMGGSNGSPMLIPGPSSPSSYAASSSQVPPSNGNYQNSYVTPLNMAVEATAINSMSFVNNTSTPTIQQQSRPGVGSLDDLEPIDPKNVEAQKLISYHLDNYKRNSAYCLPASLRPTLVQRTVPHESVIDRIPHPDLRDRLILLRGRFNLVDCLHDFASGVTIHGDDVLAHANWEIGETWLRRYGFLVDPNTLNISNKWRRERGLPELRMVDIAPEQQAST